MGSLTHAVKELKRLRRLSLDPGEQKMVSFEMPVSELAFCGPTMGPIVEPGSIKVCIAPNSTDGVEGTFEGV